MTMNNNTTTEICLEDFSSNKFLYISNIVWHVSGFIGVIIGIPGHILQIIISLNKTNRKQPISLYFIAIAICELIFLIGVLWLWCANMSLIKTDPREVVPCGIFYSILSGSTTLSNFYLALMAIDESLIILIPGRYRSFVTQTRVILRIILFFLIIIILLIPHHFYLYYNPKTTIFLCDFHSFVNYQQIHILALIHAIFFVFIPSLIVFIASVILLQNRCKHKRTYKRNLSLRARRMHRRSILIFFISLGISLSLLPSCILEIFIVHDKFLHHNLYCSKRLLIYKILLYWFLTLSSINYSIKFYIRLIISPLFRKHFIQFITCTSNRKRSTITRINNNDNNELCLLSSSNRNKEKPIEI